MPCAPAQRDGRHPSRIRKVPRAIWKQPQTPASVACWFSEDLDDGRVARSRRNPLVSGDQRRLQVFGERHVCRIVGTQILPEPPDPLQQQNRSIACDPKSGQVLNGLPGPLRGQRPLAHQTPQDLHKFHIEQMHAVQSILARIDALLDVLSGRGLKQPVNDCRGIEHNHRAARSSPIRPAVSSAAASGLRVCKRSRNSASVGRSAISRSSPSK